MIPKVGLVVPNTTHVIQIGDLKKTPSNNNWLVLELLQKIAIKKALTGSALSFSILKIIGKNQHEIISISSHLTKVFNTVFYILKG